MNAALSSARGGVLATAFVVVSGAIVATGLSISPARSAPTDIRWGTGPVGSSGQRALVVLANMLNRNMPNYRITVMPTPGAVTTVKGFATGQFEGYYGSDIALREFASDTGRFEGFKSHVTREPIQSFWCYTLDVGLAINARDRDTITEWNDLSGKQVFTGPLPFDVRLYLESAMAAVGVKDVYKQIDLSTVGSIRSMLVYAAGGRTPPPWLSEASLAVDWAALNPSPEELATLKAKGFPIVEADPAIFHKKNVYAKQMTLLPFYWGFDIGLNVPTDDMDKMLTIIDQHSDELAKADPSFRQIAGGHMAVFEKQALERTWNLVPIHPGLAKYLKAKGMWDSKWDSNVATTVTRAESGRGLVEPN
jgi:TRAP-type uncharacterized transport system substrate-binding protein